MQKPIGRAAAVLFAGLLVVPLMTGVADAQSRRKGKRPMVTEPETGIRLPVTLNVLESMIGLRITGTAVREKTMFEIDIYAAGHYVRADEARAELWRWKGKTAEQLAGDRTFRRKLVTPGFTRALRLQFARDVSADDFKDAFDEALGPRVAKLVKKGVAGKRSDVDKLKRFIEIDELVEGTKIDLVWQGDTLTVSLDVKQIGSVRSEALCRAMWEIYFGKEPVQSEFPESLLARFPRILATAEKPAEAPTEPVPAAETDPAAESSDRPEEGKQRKKK